MRRNQWIGVIIGLVGIGCIFGAHYIQQKVSEGRQQILEGEKKVSTGKTLFGLTPYTKEVGDKMIFDSADKKIAKGKRDVAFYAQRALSLQRGGFLLVAIGIGLFFLCRKKS